MSGAGFQDPEPPGPLSKDEVRVWRIAVAGAGNLAAARKDLDEEERARAACFRRNADGVRFVRAHSALRRLLAAQAGCAPHELRMGEGDRGKPFLLDGPEGLEFNLSHSGDFALVAMTIDRAVGVDVERERQKESIPELARRFFSPREVRELESLPQNDRLTAFFQTWARKEAFIKATGRGLAQPLSAFDVSLAGPARLISVRGGDAGDWDLQALEVAPGYAAAVVAAGKDWKLVTCTFTP